MRKGILFFICVFSGVAASVFALLVPAHLRAVDPLVLQQIGEHGASLTSFARNMALRNAAATKIVLQAAEELHLPETESVLDLLREAGETPPPRRALLRQLERRAAGRVQVREATVLDALRNADDRDSFRQSLQSSEARRILLNRNLTNTAVFAPVTSAAGLPLDVAVAVTAWLVQEGAFGSATPDGTRFNEEILRLSAAANAGREVREMEDFYLNVFALCRRLSSQQLLALVVNIDRTSSLDVLARWFQQNERDLPVIYTAVVTSGRGAGVADYLSNFPGTAVADLRVALQDGVSAAGVLADRRQPIYRSAFHNELLSDRHLQWAVQPLLKLARASHGLALVIKVILFLGSGLLFAYALIFRQRTVPDSRYIIYPKFSFVRRLAFAAVFVTLAILLGEPYLGYSDSGNVPEPPQPRVTFALFAEALTPTPQPTTSMINSSALVAMGVFFILQGSIYAVCLTKLREIRRQQLSSTMKLKLMDNEENLFDAGLYLGLFGTAASLILLTLGLIKPSLVSAYSSTLFGILFVALLKILHVRPYKRRLILEAAAEVA